MNMVFVFVDEGLGTELFLFVIDYAFQLSVLGDVAGSWLLVKGLFWLWEGGGQPSVYVELTVCQELIQTEKDGLGSLWLNIYDRVDLFFGYFEVLLAQN